MSSTTSAGARVRISPHDVAPAERVAVLRKTVLGGRGPGASKQEIADHTRDRPWLGAVPAPVERALIGRQGEHVRAGALVVNDQVLRRERHRSLRAALLGAVTALALRAVAARRLRPRRQHRT